MAKLTEELNVSRKWERDESIMMCDDVVASCRLSEIEYKQGKLNSINLVFTANWWDKLQDIDVTSEIIQLSSSLILKCQINIPNAVTDSIDDHNKDKHGCHIKIPLNHAAGRVVGGPPDAMVHVHLLPGGRRVQLRMNRDRKQSRFIRVVNTGVTRTNKVQCTVLKRFSCLVCQSEKLI